MDIIEIMESRFRSGNSVPVERAHITRKEWEELRKDSELLDERKIMISRRDEFGERTRTIHADIDLREAIRAAIAACKENA